MGCMRRIEFRLGLFCWLFNSDSVRRIIRRLEVIYSSKFWGRMEVCEKGWLKINDIESCRGMIHKLCEIYRAGESKCRILSVKIGLFKAWNDTMQTIFRIFFICTKILYLWKYIHNFIYTNERWYIL